MARTAPRALSMQNYCENARMRAVRISVSRAGKSRTALLGTHIAHRDAILGDFVNIQVIYNQKSKCKQHIRYIFCANFL